MLDFDNFKISCSQIGSLMGEARGNKRPTEAQIKKLYSTLGRDYGELSEPMKNTAREILIREIEYDPTRPGDKILANLVQIYAYEMYGKGKVSMGGTAPHQTEKGNMAEPEAIKLVSQIDGIEYLKNEEKFSNKWFQGIPDVICRQKEQKISKIIEIKASYDLPSFILAKKKRELPANLFEVMGYMDVTGCKEAEIIHVLVDMPDKIASFEEKRLRERYAWLELDEETTLERITRTLNNMEYSGIPTELKIFRRPVTFNKLAMKDVKRRVTSARKWMKGIHEMFTENAINLPETEPDQEDNV